MVEVHLPAAPTNMVNGQIMQAVVQQHLKGHRIPIPVLGHENLIQLKVRKHEIHM